MELELSAAARALEQRPQVSLASVRAKQRTSLAELWWRSPLRHALRRRFLPRRKARAAEIEGEDALEDALPRSGSFAQRAGAVVMGAALALLGAELILRIPGLPMPRDLSTYLFQCYFPEYEPAKILFQSEPLYINLHKPNYDARCHWNGYTWRHRTDAWGGRNPETWSKVDIALIGDSMIYGHGVEEEQTAAHFLRERLSAKVANLGVMGDSLPQYLARLRNFALPLQPRVVFVLTFGGNDFSDILQVRTQKMLQDFVDHGTALETNILPRDALLGAPPPGSSSFGRALEHQALVYRTLRFFLLKSEQARMPVAPQSPDVPSRAPSPTGPQPANLSSDERLAFRYFEAAFKLMRDSAKRAGTELVIVYLPALSQPDAREDRLVFHHARRSAKELGLRFVDATPVQYQDGRPVPGARLEYDGHLSEAGHRRLAALLADFVEANGLL
jgi:lysophospholipase L1-like esterase